MRERRTDITPPRHSFGTLVLQRPTSLWCPVAWRFDSVLDAIVPILAAFDPALAQAATVARADNGSGVLDMSDWCANAVTLVLAATTDLRQLEQSRGQRFSSLDPIIRALRRDSRTASVSGDTLLLTDIIVARHVGVVHVGLSRAEAPLPELAAEFGLVADASSLHEIDAKSARRLAERVLQRDLAYGQEIVPHATAAELAERLLAEFATDESHYFTNSTHDESGDLTSWNSVTRATFDTGVLVLGPLRSGCVWVEDED